MKPRSLIGRRKVAVGILLLGAILGMIDPVRASDLPEPRGPTPSERQLRWHEMEFYGMIHFGLNTFTGNEWGDGDVSASVFNPVSFDADRIVETMKATGMKGLVLVAKHHDGFCLWPSRYTEYSVKNSPWREGRGDMVREFVEACRKHGLKFGVYLSPWDRNHPDYGKPEYLVYFRDQLRELLTNYGGIFSCWYDGANGGTGYYGGAGGSRLIDRRNYYDWPGTWALVRQLQPNAVIFSDAGPDVRWVGNENGVAGDPCWMTLNRDEFYPGTMDYPKLTVGDREGRDWVPPECNTSLRRAWFYNPKHEDRAKDASALVQLYFQSVGRGGCLNLNLSPRPDGTLSSRDEETLRTFGRWLSRTFAEDLASSGAASASGVFGENPAYGAEKVIDGHRDTYWTPEVTAKNGAELILEFSETNTFNLLRIREHLPLGQRVERFAVDVRRGDGWQEIQQGTSIGPQRIVRWGIPQKTTGLRIRFLKAAAAPAIAELGLFLETTSRAAPPERVSVGSP